MANKFESEIARSFRIKEEGLPSPLKSKYEYIRISVPQIFRPGMARPASTHEQPCDALVDIYEHKGLALEMKECATRGAFPFDRVADHQVDGLQRFVYMGRNSYLLICYRKWPLTIKQKIGLKPAEIKEKEKRRCYALSIGDFYVCKHNNTIRNSKSISIEELDMLGTILPAIMIPNPSEKYPNKKDPGWDITPLLEKESL